MSHNQPFLSLGLLALICITIGLATPAPEETSLSWEWWTAIACTAIAIGKMAKNILQVIHEGDTSS